MDTLRLMLLSLLIGATVSTSPNYTNEGVQIQQPAAVVQDAGTEVAAVNAGTTVAAAQPTSPPQVQVVYVTPAPTQKPATTTASSGRRELSRGCTGDDVRTAQRLLKNLGYSISVDGVFGTQMRSVVIQFQRNNGLKADGIIGFRTYNKLTSSSAKGPGYSPVARTTLSYGMSGQDVVELQTRLKSLNYYFDLVSGNYLTNTRAAVIWFQRNNGLSADGIAGPATLSRVYSSSAIPAGGSPYYPTPVPTVGPYPVINRTLRQGMSGTDVGYLQQRLGQLNYLAISPTNYFGDQTYVAVRLFQQYNSLYADGVAGPATISRLFSSSAIPYDRRPLPTWTPGPIWPTPTPTWTPGPYQNQCQFCKQYYSNADSSQHYPKACQRHCLSQTGINCVAAGCNKNHYMCDGKNHGAAGCGGVGHTYCDGTHNLLTCKMPGHYECDTTISPTAYQHRMQCTYCSGWECINFSGTCPGTGNTGPHNYVNR